jgi:exosortase/archaeosortase family protein
MVHSGTPSKGNSPTRPAPDRAALRPVGGFILRFVGGWVVVLAMAAWVPGLERWAVHHTIGSIGGAARLLHIRFSSSGSSLALGGASIEIVPDCTPLMPVAALWIAIFAFPASWRWRATGALLGVVLLWLYNLLRIFALIPVLLYRPQWFEFIHVYLWQTLTLLVVFALFVAWLGFQRRGEPRRAAPPVPAPGPSGA